MREVTKSKRGTFSIDIVRHGRPWLMMVAVEYCFDSLRQREKVTVQLLAHVGFWR